MRPSRAARAPPARSDRPSSHLSGRSRQVSDDVWMVLGLGNPGPGYAGNRHNVGYRVADLLAERVGASWRRHKSGRGQVVEGRIGALPGTRVVLARPRSYMNESGGATAALIGFYRVPTDRLVVVHDELDVGFGELRLKFGGGDGGHNGLRSLRRALGTGDFFRVRFGIGRPSGRREAADFVLSDFSTAERRELGYHLDRAADSVESLVLDGLATAQNTYHA